MMAFPGMLVDAATQAGMAVPLDPDRFSNNDFPHFFVFCQLQLGRRMAWDEHWENAKVIAQIPVEELKKLTLEGFIARGLRYTA